MVAVEEHTKENPRRPYATGLRTQPALVVRGSSRRITIMRLESAKIRVINRRDSYLDRDPHRFPQAGIKPKPRSELTGRSISGAGLAPPAVRPRRPAPPSVPLLVVILSAAKDLHSLRSSLNAVILREAKDLHFLSPGASA